MFLKATDEERFMRKVAKGDKVAFRELALIYQKPLHNFCIKMMNGADHAADDVLQHVLIAWWQKASQWRKGRGTLKAWLFTIAANKCKDYLRTHKVNLIEIEDSHAVEDNFFIKFENIDQREMVLKSINQLSSKQKDAVWLFYFEEMKQADVAQSMGLSLKAVESHLTRAKKKLHADLKNIKEDLL